MNDDAPLVHTLLHTLAQEGVGASVSLPRLSKRLGLSASVLLRTLNFLGDARWGGRQGPGWVQVWQEEGRWRVCLTDAGRAMLDAPVAPEK